MALTSDAMLPVTPRNDRLPVILFAISILISLCAVWLFDHASAGRSLFSLANLVGPTTESLLHGGGLTVCTEAMGTPHNPICFHAARMPLPSLIVGMAISLLGNHYLRVAFFKAVLLLLPLELSIYLVWLRMPHPPSLRRIGMTLLLLAPFAVPAFLADVVNLQVEEGYSYSLLAMAVAILFFGIERSSPAASVREHVLGNALLFATALDGVYLAKSAMAPAVAVLLLGYLLMERRIAPRLLVLALVVAAPIGWALHQYHASGRYSVGTSLDGINLHKGNNPEFLDHYPPPPGDTIDRFDQDLNLGHQFGDEWSFNDYHRQAALDFLLHHPRATIEGDMRKLNVMLLSVHKIGSTREHGVARLAEAVGLTLFRFILWAAMFGALYALFRPGEQNDPSFRMIGGIFLALVAACVLPYVAGFGYTRHSSILIYPATLMCCRMLIDNVCGEEDGAPRRRYR